MLKNLFVKFLLLIVFISHALYAQNWSPLTSGTTSSLISVHFVNNLTGYVCGAANTLRKTTNGGLSWFALNSSLNSSFDLRCVYFTTPDVGWVCATGNRIVFTSNGGASWSLQSTGSQTNNLYSIYFINQSTGWVVGEDGYMRRTVNGGVNWLSQGSGTGNSLLSVFFTGSGTGWIGGESGNVRRSLDYGVNWSGQVSQPSVINSIKFLDNSTGYLVGVAGMIRYTSNSGANWNAQTSGTLQYLYDIEFINSATGWIVGSGGTILKTTNSGNTWISDISGAGNIVFFSVDFPGTTVGYASASNGAIYKYNPPTAVNNYSNEVPNSFKLYNNYPNPFNPSTTIKFDIAKGSNVKITIYDILGKEVKILVNENLKAGKYQINFDASSISSGTYFYRVDAGDYSEIKKMVLLK